VPEPASDKDASRRLKEMVGLDPTPDPRAPLPPGALPPLGVSGTRPPLPTPFHDPGTDTEIEALLAMSEPAPPVVERRGTKVTASEVFVSPHSEGSLDAAPSSDFTPAPAEPMARPRPGASTNLGLGPGVGGNRVGSTTGSVRSAGATGQVRVGSGTGPVRTGASGPVRTGGSTGPVPRAGGATGPVPYAAGSSGALPANGAAQTGAWAAQDPSVRRTGGTPPRRRALDALLLGGILAVLGGGGALFFFLKPGFLSGRTPERVEAEKVAAEAERARLALEQTAAACKATLTVADAPPHSEVLLRVGAAPADVERMPVGTRLEFVAVLDGHRAKRAVVPAGASWDRGEGGRPRYEVAVQLDPAPKRGSDVWPPAEPGSEVGGKGAPGTVHVVSTPKGAEVWLLAGVGPEAVIEQLRCNEPVDVLVAGPTTYRRRLHLDPDDFKPAGDNANARSARVSAKAER
jgi:hypothetical protein